MDRIIRFHGHIPQRTPPYMCKLNPIELIWAQLKLYIRNHNTTGDLSTKDLMEQVSKGFESITPVHWANCCKHVINIENTVWEVDQYMEEVEPLIIQTDNDISSDDDSDTNSDDESDKEN